MNRSIILILFWLPIGIHAGIAIDLNLGLGTKGGLVAYPYNVTPYTILGYEGAIVGYEQNIFSEAIWHSEIGADWSFGEHWGLSFGYTSLFHNEWGEYCQNDSISFFSQMATSSGKSIYVIPYRQVYKSNSVLFDAVNFGMLLSIGSYHTTMDAFEFYDSAFSITDGQRYLKDSFRFVTMGCSFKMKLVNCKLARSGIL